jgi:hypothetical protein
VPAAAALEAGRRHIRHRKLTRFYRDRLRRRLSVPVASLPLLYRETLATEDLEALAERAERW